MEDNNFISFFTGVSGWLPDHLAHDAVWNRTANLVGGPGKNLALDLVNEFENREFKSKNEYYTVLSAFSKSSDAVVGYNYTKYIN